jgi:hypothetical protein
MELTEQLVQLVLKVQQEMMVCLEQMVTMVPMVMELHLQQTMEMAHLL